jgi:hypothetical protein
MNMFRNLGVASSLVLIVIVVFSVLEIYQMSEHQAGARATYRP